MSTTRRRITKAIPADDPHHDIRVIWSGDNKRILSDNRTEKKQANE
jgi:hypothetical protein